MATCPRGQTVNPYMAFPGQPQCVTAKPAPKPNTAKRNEMIRVLNAQAAQNAAANPNAKRLVIIEGSAEQNITAFTHNPSTAYVANEIRGVLEENNFEVVNVGINFPSLGSRFFYFRLEINVFNRHTAQEASSNAVRLINQTKGSLGTLLFNNVRAGVASDGIAPKPINQTNNPNLAGANNTLDSFAAGLGVSTPVALVGGAILLFVLLRR